MLKRSVIEDHLRIIFPDADMSQVTMERLGGMSNMNYKVTIEGKSYVLRIPGIGAEGMVERANEEKNSILSGEMGINTPVCYFDAKTGVKLTEFIENAETLHPETICTEDNLKQIAAIYWKLHNSKVRLRNGFNIFYEIEKYDALIEKAGAKMYEKQGGVRSQIFKLEERLNRMGIELKPCHNDAVPENFIKSPEGRVYLIDWEYSGMNDPMADFAALFLESDFSEKDQEKVLDAYFGEMKPVDLKERILIYQILWDYLWAQWTVIKEAKGDDFGTYGRDRFNRAKENLKKLQ